MGSNDSQNKSSFLSSGLVGFGALAFWWLTSKINYCKTILLSGNKISFSIFFYSFVIYTLSMHKECVGQEQRAYGEFSAGSSLKTEKKLLEQARNKSKERNYNDAAQKYSELLKRDSTNPMYNFEMAQTYYNNFRQPQSIPYYEKAIMHSKDTIGEAYYFLASACHLAGNFEMAQKNYRIYYSLLDSYGTALLANEQIDLLEEVKRKIEMCDNGKILIKSPNEKITLNGKTHSFEISSLGKGVNSEYDDCGAVLSSNDSVMYFTSRRNSATGEKVDYDDKFFEDIYVSESGKNGWGVSAGVGAPVNTDKHEAIITISPDGKTIYFFRGLKQRTFYYSRKAEGMWTTPEQLFEKSGLSTGTAETNFYCFTILENEMYMVSDAAGGTGGRDIYVSKKQPDGSWGALSEIGAPVNSKYDEDSPYITPDGKTMYFSSQGHNSMGGFDIFKSEKNSNKWSEPVNLGVPVNTPGDDLYFIVANKSDCAYYSSSGKPDDDTKDMDIYRIDLCDDIPTTLISGHAMGVTRGIIGVRDKESGNEIGSFDILDGNYFIKVGRGKKYVFTLKTSGIDPASAEIYVPKQCRAYELYQELNFSQTDQTLLFRNAFFDIHKEAGGMNYSEFLAKADKSKLPGYSEVSVATHAVMVVAVDTVKKVSTLDAASGKGKTDTATVIKTTLSFNNVFFDFGKSTLKKDFEPELDKAVALLKKEYPKIKFEVAGHTDSKGADSYNMNLSKRRAGAVANYLASKGISKSRMKVAGYGETKPISPNENPDGTDNPDGRAKNRRTEIVIIR